MDSIKTFFFASCLTCLLFVSCYLHMNSFYSWYGVDIKQWIDWDEWIPLSFPGLLNQLWSISIISACCSGALYFQKQVTKDFPASSLASWKIKMMFITIYLGCAFLMIYSILTFENKDSRVWTIPLFIFPIILTGSYLVFAPILSKSLKRKITRTRVVVTIILLSIFIHPLTYGSKTANGRLKGGIYATAHLKSEKYDSLIYLGSTKRQFFLYSENTRTTLILRKDSVRRIEMVSGNDRLLIR